MRRSKAEPIGSILNDIIRDQHLSQGLDLERIKTVYPKVVGKNIAAHSKNFFLKNKILYISINSSVIINELVMIKEPLIAKMNQEIGHPAIKDIVFR